MTFMDAGLGTVSFDAVFVLGLELIGPSKRVFGATIMTAIYSLGHVLLGVLAMYVNNFRTFLQIMHWPAFLMIAYFWLVPESVRWLKSVGRNEEASRIILKAAKINKVILSDHALQTLNYGYSDKPSHKDSDVTEELLPNEIQSGKTKTKNPIFEVLSSKSLLLRVVNCSFCWLTNFFVYFGLTLNSVSLSGNKYINFIVVGLAELPALIVTYYLTEKLGRKWSLCGSLVISGLTCVACELMPSDALTWRLVLFLSGKCAISVSLTVLYIYTTELFPTNIRQSMMSICSTFGRIGSMLAPLTPLLVSSIKLFLIVNNLFYFIKDANYASTSAIYIWWNRNFVWSSCTIIPRDTEHEATGYNTRS